MRNFLFCSVVLVACGGDNKSGNMNSPGDTAAAADASLDTSSPSSPDGGDKRPPFTGFEWDETATWTEYSSLLELSWTNEGGDWLDRDGVARGPTAFATAEVKETTPLVTIDVTSAITATKRADFYVTRSGGTNATFSSREAASGRPELVINGTTRLSPEADTTLNDTTSSTLGGEPTLQTKRAFLIRFRLPDNLTVTDAKLVLTPVKVYGNQTLSVYSPHCLTPAAWVPARASSRPAWVVEDPTVVATFTAADIKWNRKDLVIKDGVVVADPPPMGGTWMTGRAGLPNAADGKPYSRLCATFIEKLSKDFAPSDGGKHPGLTNTGAVADPGNKGEVVNNKTYYNSGWGGEQADGLHWSARTGYGGRSPEWVSAHTYFYALTPKAKGWPVWAVGIGYPYPKGKWFAYTQCVEVNTVTNGVGNADGKLYYERPDVGPLFDEEDIVFRNVDAPEGRIREVWVDYYCGGTGCTPKGSVSFAKAIITKGAPNASSILAEVAKLEANGP